MPLDLLARFSQIEVEPTAVTWRDLINVRGLEALPLRVAWR